MNSMRVLYQNYEEGGKESIFKKIKKLLLSLPYLHSCFSDVLRERVHRVHGRRWRYL